jgi:membrane-associated protein
VHLKELIATYGEWVYAILFLTIFVETGVVIAPFLPGDSLLFAAGALAGDDLLSPLRLFLTLSLASLLGDSSNYWIGRFVGPRVLRSETSRWLNRRHLDRTHAFFEKYGGKTVIIARFVPIVRTFAPFVAGIGAMRYPRFLMFSIMGSALWVGTCVLAGYRFGRLPIIREHFELAVLAVIAISLLPALIEFLRARRRRQPAPPRSVRCEGERT